tara:strand:- start:335 stop:691 length:357 start_codon:yes stop_codon:yes gene_type:complete
MKKLITISALLFAFSLNVSAQYQIKIIEEDSLHRVKLTQFGDDYDKIILFEKMEIKAARDMRDSLDLIYTSIDDQLDADLQMYTEDVEMIQDQLKQAKAEKGKVERQIKRRDDRKANK